VNPDTPIYVAGHRGVVGAALVRALGRHEYGHLILRTRQEVDLSSPAAVDDLFVRTKPEIVILAAARVGGIGANIAAPVEFLVENLEIQNNLLLACQRHGVGKTVFLGSSCVYPRESPQPMREEYFMHGPVEPTNESYAVAKIAGIRLAQALHQQHGMSIICPMPCNVYGPGDHFEFERSHVISALVRRFCEATDAGAPLVTLWGTGRARREFLHVDDLAEACLFLIDRYDDPGIINVGSGSDHAIAEIARTIARLTGYRGAIDWDLAKPDGMPRKLLDVKRIHDLGWTHTIELEQGLVGVIEDFRAYQRKAHVESGPA
jgi:GDP-L-fucose synthase